MWASAGPVGETDAATVAVLLPAVFAVVADVDAVVPDGLVALLSVEVGVPVAVVLALLVGVPDGHGRTAAKSRTDGSGHGQCRSRPAPSCCGGHDGVGSHVGRTPSLLPPSVVGHGSGLHPGSMIGASICTERVGHGVGVGQTGGRVGMSRTMTVVLVVHGVGPLDGSDADADPVAPMTANTANRPATTSAALRMSFNLDMRFLR